MNHRIASTDTKKSSIEKKMTADWQLKKLSQIAAGMCIHLSLEHDTGYPENIHNKAKLISLFFKS